MKTRLLRTTKILGKNNKYFIIPYPESGRKKRYDTYREEYGSKVMHRIGCELTFSLSKEIVKHYEKIK